MKTLVNGNLLGSSRAETDTRMLDLAFVETADYATLTKTRDFNFVVGRRGTGKSALHHKLAKFFAADKNVLLVRAAPLEEESLALQSVLSRFGSDYTQLRHVSKIAWKIHLLIDAAQLLRRHYKTRSGNAAPFVTGYLARHKPVSETTGLPRCGRIIDLLCDGSDYKATVARIAHEFEVEPLRLAVQQSLNDGGLTVVYLYDGLDEGWTPDVLPSSIIGGLAKAAAELVESDVGVYPIIFVRDNMFRALGELDTDFTRHIDGSTVRLHWEESSLLHLVTQRLRVALALDLENDVKVWNRFAQKELEGREGFRAALQQTLYRPRDILALLNDAAQLARREGRLAIVESDLAVSAHGISKMRLDDLYNEYDRVFPGLKLFVEAFIGGRAVWRVSDIWELLEAVLTNASYDRPGSSAFALFTEPQEVFFALYSVGFLGVGQVAVGAYTFCHDGSLRSPQDIHGASYATIHPCYWRALNVAIPEDAQALVVQINDEHDENTAANRRRAARSSEKLGQIRTKLLGTIADELPRMPRGAEGAAAFEKWVLRAVKVLFDSKLVNPEAKPNPGALQQRDIVATNVAESGFWRRIYDDYRARQVIFECKNYDDVTGDDFRQVLGYSGVEYGKFAVLVTRADREYLSENEEQWIRELYFKHDKQIVMLVQAEVLARCIKKLRNQQRTGDYTEDVFGKQMDIIVRRVLSLAHARKYRRKKR